MIEMMKDRYRNKDNNSSSALLQKDGNNHDNDQLVALGDLKNYKSF